MKQYDRSLNTIHDDEKVLFYLSEASDKEIRQTVHAEDAFSAIKEFIDDVNSGKLKPRATQKKFQSLLDKTS